MGYLAPEVIEGEPSSERSDIWSAGAVLYEVATGKPLYPERQTVALVQAIVSTTPDTSGLEEVRASSSFREVVSECLRRDPTSRPSAVALMTRFSEVDVEGRSDRATPG